MGMMIGLDGGGFGLDEVVRMIAVGRPLLAIVKRGR